jgi:hypothetical protein
MNPFDQKLEQVYERSMRVNTIDTAHAVLMSRGYNEVHKNIWKNHKGERAFITQTFNGRTHVVNGKIHSINEYDTGYTITFGEHVSENMNLHAEFKE